MSNAKSKSKSISINTFLRSKRGTSGATQSEYKNVAKTLRKYHDFSFNLRGNLSPQQKGAITRKANQLKTFVRDIEEGAERERKLKNSYSEKDNGQKTKFVKFKNAKERRIALKTFGANVVTNKGLLLKTPSSRGKKQSHKITPDYVKIKTGAQTRMIFPVHDPVNFMLNPRAEIEKEIALYGDPHAVTFTFNGYAMGDSISLDRVAFFFTQYAQTDMNQSLNGFMLIYLDDDKKHIAKPRKQWKKPKPKTKKANAKTKNKKIDATIL